MGFDLQYLLFLQNLRESTGGVFDEFFNALSKFAVDILPYLPFVVYWCVNKKLGYRFMATAWIGEVLNGVIKLTVCAYRPWIRSDSIVPAGDSKVAATGYSFPSGHTLAANVIFGECKFTNDPMDVDVYYHLLEKIEKVDWKKQNRINHFVFFSFNGYSEKLKQLAEEKDNILLYE